MTVIGDSLIIEDDDAAPTGFELSLEDSTGNDLTSIGEGGEEDGATAVTVRATARTTLYAQNQTVTVTVGADGDTATSADYTTDVATFDITIEAGQQSGTATFMLDPSHDTIDEGDSDETYETLTVSGTHGGDDNVVATSIAIVDNDDPPTGFELSLEDSNGNDLTSVDEGGEEDGAIAVTVR
ncbi:MAG: hypothetical protein ERJ69_02465, partial [Aphanocapsa feldmannii 288cV]